MTDFQIIHIDPAFVVCIKPPRILSTDEPGGVPDLCREALGDQNIRTVHRLDRVVSGLMVLARTKRAASDLSAQIRDGIFHKEYTAVLHGVPDSPTGTLADLLARTEQFSKVRIELITGRTHQIRCQFSSPDLPLVGDRKYSTHEDDCEIALWSSLLRFNHPKTGEPLTFTAPPPSEFPWNTFTP